MAWTLTWTKLLKSSPEHTLENDTHEVLFTDEEKTYVMSSQLRRLVNIMHNHAFYK